jgi:hypothetical protein
MRGTMNSFSVGPALFGLNFYTFYCVNNGYAQSAIRSAGLRVGNECGVSRGVYKIQLCIAMI